MFHVANHRQQLIVSASFDETARAKYVAMKKSNPTEPMILVTQRKVMLKDAVEEHGMFEAQIMTNESYVLLSGLNQAI